MASDKSDELFTKLFNNMRDTIFAGESADYYFRFYVSILNWLHEFSAFLIGRRMRLQVELALLSCKLVTENCVILLSQ